MKDEQSSATALCIFEQLFFKTGRFPGDQHEAIIPAGETPDFVNTSDQISPRELYKRFNSTEAQGLVSVQVLAALNVFMNGDRMTSKDAMSEFFHKLSMQALDQDDPSVQKFFTAITTLQNALKDKL